MQMINKLSCPRCRLSHTVEYEPGFCDDEADVDEPSDEWAYDIFAHARDSVRRLIPPLPPHQLQDRDVSKDDPKAKGQTDGNVGDRECPLDWSVRRNIKNRKLYFTFTM